MLRCSADVRVDRPVEKVFAWLTDAGNQGKFDKSSLKMELLTPGPWRTGSQFRELRDLGGRKTEVLSEITELEPNRRFVIHSKTGPGSDRQANGFPDIQTICQTPPIDRGRDPCITSAEQ